MAVALAYDIWLLIGDVLMPHITDTIDSVFVLHNLESMEWMLSVMSDIPF